MKKFRKMLKYFSLVNEATNFPKLTGLNSNTVKKYLLLVRKKITEKCEMESPFSGDIEVDESFVRARRVKGKRRRGAGGKTIVFGLLKRNGKIYTKNNS
jgi:transposase